MRARYTYVVLSVWQAVCNKNQIIQTSTSKIETSTSSAGRRRPAGAHTSTSHCLYVDVPLLIRRRVSVRRLVLAHINVVKCEGKREKILVGDLRMRVKHVVSSLKMSENEVLCLLGERRRPVKYSVQDGKSDLESLNEAVKETFQDIITSSTKLFLQLKNESWEGEFVDINEVERIPNRAVIRAVVDDSKSEVNIFFTFNVMLTIKPCF